MSIRGVTTALSVAVLFCAVGLPTNAQTEKTGEFDINKVRQAVLEQEPVDEAEEPRQEVQESESFAAILFRITGYLAVVIVLIFGVFWLMKRVGVVGTSRVGGGSMDVLEALPLGQGRFVVLVRVMDCVLVLAQSAQQTTLLDRIEGEKAVELIASTKGGTSIVQFKDMFNSFLGKAKKA